MKRRKRNRGVAYLARNIDGGSRGNPGPASYGVVIRDPRGEIVARLKKYIGQNHQQCGGILRTDCGAGLRAEPMGSSALRVESDSELMVKQMRGQYKVKSEDLKPLFERAKKMSQTFSTFRIEHVYREQNKEADALANEAMDEVSGKASSSGVTGAVSEPRAPRNEVIKIRARFRSGILYPLEDVNLPDGAEVEILLKPTSKS